MYLVPPRALDGVNGVFVKENGNSLDVVVGLIFYLFYFILILIFTRIKLVFKQMNAYRANWLTLTR